MLLNILPLIVVFHQNLLKKQAFSLFSTSAISSVPTTSRYATKFGYQAMVRSPLRFKSPY